MVLKQISVLQQIHEILIEHSIDCRQIALGETNQQIAAALAQFELAGHLLIFG